ncbi:TRAP transporter small permease [Gemmobacter nectariphilus]|uniref:TRAP transporter small permease n=1 Tax=Gemmobacter nectariphilus TaxID=220343 RepID=UPI000489350F|nr:TRAP transporter small permease [Gemmobacter nectariphilus]
MRRAHEIYQAIILRMATVLGAAALALMMLAGVTDALGRTMFSRPLWGAAELVELSMALMTFLIIPAVTRARSHVSIDLLDNILRPVRRLQHVLADLLGGGIFVLMAWRTWIQGDRAADYGDLTQVFSLPVSLIYHVAAVLLGMTVLSFALNLVDDLSPEGPREPEHNDEEYVQ